MIFTIDDGQEVAIILDGMTISDAPSKFLTISDSKSKPSSEYYQSPSDLLSELLYRQNHRSGMLLGDYVSDTEIQKIKDSLDLGFAPSSIKLKKYYDLALHEHKARNGRQIKLSNPFEFLLPVFPFSPGNNYRASFFGPSGIGKTRLVAAILRVMVQYYPQTKIYVFSRLEFDPSLDPDLGDNIMRIMMDENILSFEPNIIEPGSICLFDDIETLVNSTHPPKMTKMIIDRTQDIRDDLLKTGRHMGTSVFSVCHDIMGGWKTKVVHSESTHIFFFINKGYDEAIRRMLAAHYGMTKMEIDRLFTLGASWIMISVRSPRLVMYREGSYFL